jgi:hypothetical protein
MNQATPLLLCLPCIVSRVALTISSQQSQVFKITQHNRMEPFYTSSHEIPLVISSSDPYGTSGSCNLDPMTDLVYSARALHPG